MQYKKEALTWIIVSLLLGINNAMHTFSRNVLFDKIVSLIIIACALASGIIVLLQIIEESK